MAFICIKGWVTQEWVGNCGLQGVMFPALAHEDRQLGRYQLSCAEKSSNILKCVFYGKMKSSLIRKMKSSLTRKWWFRGTHHKMIS